jgi:predicted 3-demethylubiquinone-9 3-methyltransferase (glyoxalase superfamily)
MATHKIITCLWFDKDAEEAANYYASIFKDSKIGRKSYYSNEGKEVHGMDEGTLMAVEYELNGSKFMNLNGGNIPFTFNMTVSFIINCDTQEEIDHYWEKLREGGDPAVQECGWLKDKYGVTWQVSTPILDEFIASPDREKADRVMKAMLPMKKIIIKDIEEAAKG